MTDNTSKLKDAGLKVTHPRTKILEVLQSNPDFHLSADAIHSYLSKHNESIGLATVYRVLTQLEIAGLIQKNQFKDNQSTYEIKKQHHDHLICTKCSAIFEFEDEIIEERQRIIAASYGMTIVSHTLDIYGICEQCQQKTK